jgi:endonuclease YncB( thermonuclease family)
MRPPVTRSAALVALVLAGAACLIVVRYVVAIRESPVASETSTPRVEAAPLTRERAEADVEAPDRPVRDVTPQGVARVFMPPPAPGSRRMPAPSAMRITQAGVSPNGIISGEGGAVRLYGVAFPDGRKICASATGERWACGRRAYIALHNRIAFEEVNCEPKSAADPPEAECFAGDANLAAWLLAEGLVQLAADVTDKELVAAEAAARTAKRGLWSEAAEPAAASAQRP